MRMSMATSLIAIVAFPLSLAAQSPATPPPVCTADLEGRQLRMSLEYSDGFMVEAFWNVSKNGGVVLPDGTAGSQLGLRLNELVVTEPETGRPEFRPLAEPVTLTYQGPTVQALILRASRVWCIAIEEVREEGPSGNRRTASVRSP